MRRHWFREIVQFASEMVSVVGIVCMLAGLASIADPTDKAGHWLIIGVALLAGGWAARRWASSRPRSARQ